MEGLDINMLKTTFLMALLTGVLVAVGGVFAGHTGMIVMLIISIGMNFMTYWYSDKWALAAYDAQEVTASEAPELYHLVETLASRDSLPMPRVYIIDSDVPNAFATGRNPAHAAVAVTTGIMRVLDYNEIAGVLAHELSHVKHRDILISTIAAAFAGVISIVSDVTRWSAMFGMNSDEDNNSVIGFIFTIIVAPIAAMLIQLAISRSREYSADEAGGKLCGNPMYLASALEKLEYCAEHMPPLEKSSPATAHMFIVDPLENAKTAFKNLFSTHPATSDRIAHLRAQAADMQLLQQ